jgi:hypothetical protein
MRVAITVSCPDGDVMRADQAGPEQPDGSGDPDVARGNDRIARQFGRGAAVERKFIGDIGAVRADEFDLLDLRCRPRNQHEQPEHAQQRQRHGPRMRDREIAPLGEAGRKRIGAHRGKAERWNFHACIQTNRRRGYRD